MMKRPLGILLLALLGACRSSAGSEAVKESARSAAAIEIESAPAATVELPEYLDLEGTLAAYRQAALSPLVAGHVSKVTVERGDQVKEGTPLVHLRAASYQLQASAANARAQAQREQLGLEAGSKFDPEAVPSVVAAKTERDLAADNLRRLTPLRETGAIDERSYEQAKAAAEAAEARYEAAKRQASSGYASYRSLRADAAARGEDARNTILRAPFDGAIVERNAEVGEYVSPMQPIVKIVDASKLRLELDVPERWSGVVGVGQPAEIHVDGTAQKLDGKVEFVAAAIDRERRTLTIEVIADNPDIRVRAGHFARARLLLDGKRQAVRVPRGSIVERAGVRRIYVVDEGVARARIIELIEQREDGAYVRGSVQDGEAIIVNPPAELADGAPVRTKG